MCFVTLCLLCWLVQYFVIPVKSCWDRQLWMSQEDIVSLFTMVLGRRIIKKKEQEFLVNLCFSQSLRMQSNYTTWLHWGATEIWLVSNIQVHKYDGCCLKVWRFWIQTCWLTGSLSIWSLHVLPVPAWVFIWVLWFPSLPYLKDMQIWSTGYSKLPIVVNECSSLRYLDKLPQVYPTSCPKSVRIDSNLW